MPKRPGTRFLLLTLCLFAGLAFVASVAFVTDADYAGAISAYRRANGLPAGARRVGAALVDNQKSPYRKFRAMMITD